MAEGYIAQECITFCSRYFDGVETVFNRPKRNDDTPIDDDLYLVGMLVDLKGRNQWLKLLS